MTDTLERREVISEALKAAYIQGATDVDTYLRDGGELPNGEPDFGETASDYVSSIDLAALSLPAREVSEERARELIEELDQAAQTWGWERDQGVGDSVIHAGKRYDAAKAALLAALATTPASREKLEADLVRLVEEMLDNLKHCSLSSGCCHCGDSMDKHADPMCCGHTPVDMGWTASENWIAKAEATLTKLDRSAEEG